MSPQLLEAPSKMGRPKKAPTEQIRLAVDVIELAWKCAPHHGFRGSGAAGDFLSDVLRPILLADEDSRRAGSADRPTPPKKGSGK